MNTTHSVFCTLSPGLMQVNVFLFPNGLAPDMAPDHFMNTIFPIEQPVIRELTKRMRCWPTFGYSIRDEDQTSHEKQM